MKEVFQANEEKRVADQERTKSDKWVGACACVVATLVAPLVLALWCANVGVMARAWHWMLGGF